MMNGLIFPFTVAYAHCSNTEGECRDLKAFFGN